MSLANSVINIDKTKNPSLDQIKFQQPEKATLINREYGLIRVGTHLASTPFPRHSTGVDAATLKARLTENIIDKNRPLGSHGKSKLNFHGSTIRDSRARPKVSTGTPHPSKAIVIEPKQMMAARFGLINYESQQLPWANLRDLSQNQITRNYSVIKAALSVRPPQSEFRGCLKTTPTQPTKKTLKKKVTILIPTTTESINIMLKDTISSTTSYWSSKSSSVQSRIELSFLERRRLFYSGEYTIAKNGKKMSDFLMTIPTKPMNVLDQTAGADKVAKEAIENFARKQGYDMDPTGAIRFTQRWSAETQGRSLSDA